MNNNNDSQKLAIFKDKAIRRILHKGQWWFSIIDVCAVLTDSTNPRRYWSDLKKQITEKEGFVQLYEKIVQFKMEAPDSKMRETDCANTESLFRIIQSIPSPKAEPFKRWRAKVGYERIQEIADPEKSINRGRDNWKKHGRSEECLVKKLGIS
jgi:prophage antirepressor-like protein